MRVFLFHLPLIGSLLIAGAISAIDAGIVPGLRTERPEPPRSPARRA